MLKDYDWRRVCSIQMTFWILLDYSGKVSQPHSLLSVFTCQGYLC